MADAMQPPVRGPRRPKDADIALTFSPHRPSMGFCKRQRLGTDRRLWKMAASNISICPGCRVAACRSRYTRRASG